MHADPLARGQRIAGLRHAAGWSQRRLAEAAGVSHSYIALLELGRLPSPSKFRLDSVARALSLRTSDALMAPLPVMNSATVGKAAEMSQTANVVGGLDQLRPAGSRPLPVFRWGSCGDPRDRESPPDPDHLEYPPAGRDTLIGLNGFGVLVKGESMAGRGIYDRDIVWVNPERPYQLRKVVLALVSDVNGASRQAGPTRSPTAVLP